MNIYYVGGYYYLNNNQISKRGADILVEDGATLINETELLGYIAEINDQYSYILEVTYSPIGDIDCKIINWKSLFQTTNSLGFEILEYPFEMRDIFTTKEDAVDYMLLIARSKSDVYLGLLREMREEMNFYLRIETKVRGLDD